MENLPLISVIVPVYKVEAYLDRCISSIIQQTYTNLEIILVDDGSPDRCPQMCDAWAEKDRRIRVIHKENGGLSDARNAGMQVAAGTYIAFVDSDDWVSNAFVENLYMLARENDCDVVGCAFRMTDHTDCEEMTQDTKKPRIVNRDTAVRDLIDDRIRQVVWNKLYKRELIQNIPFVKGKLHEDEFWSYQVLAQTNRYAEIDAVGYYYFQRTESIMGKSYSLRRLDALEAKEGRQVYLQRYLPAVADHGQINLFFSCMYHGQMALKYLNYKDCQAAFVRLKKVSREWRLLPEQKKTMKVTHRLWVQMAECSLSMTCRVRNLLSIGL